jgi:3-oxoacyl-[acyl-carrier protein] reductase
MSEDFAGRVAIVTGAAQNIGRAVALQLAAGGAKIVVNAKSSRAAAQATVEAICDTGGQAILHLADVTDESATAGLIAAAIAAFGGIDILVNNAAVRREQKFEEMTLAEWHSVLAVILDGAFLCGRAALPHLRKSSRPSIVNLGGMSAHLGSVGRAHVITAKTGIIGFTRALAHDLAPDRITVNCVVPGRIATVRGASAGASGAVGLHEIAIPLGRRGTSDEVASMVRFLCGPDARYLTGQTMHVNGGAFLP